MKVLDPVALALHIINSEYKSAKTIRSEMREAGKKITETLLYQILADLEFQGFIESRENTGDRTGKSLDLREYRLANSDPAPKAV